MTGESAQIVCVCDGGENQSGECMIVENYCVEHESHSMCDVAATSPQMKSYPKPCWYLSLNN